MVVNFLTCWGISILLSAVVIVEWRRHSCSDMNALGTYFIDEEIQCTGVVVIVVLFLGKKQNQTFPGLPRF
jgi:hypothetical protein